MLLFPLILACLSPTACPEACESVADSCGLGPGLEECLAACRNHPRADYQRRDLTWCLQVKDCGGLVTGECSGAADGLCPGAAYVHVGLSPECGAAEGSSRGVSIGGWDCVAEPAGDWGDLGVPTVEETELVFSEDCRVSLPRGEAVCAAPGGECSVYVREVF